MKPKESSLEIFHQYISEIFEDNARHVENAKLHVEDYFPVIQKPRATLLMCSDSRMQAAAFDATPINDLFVIRNIGNQISTAEGSIEYGVLQLKTPVLLIAGHSRCGAIDASLKNHSHFSPYVRAELDSLQTNKARTIEEAVIENIHKQVDYALSKFASLVLKGELFINGLLYDFSNDYQLGHGKLILLNINGEKDPKKLMENPVHQLSKFVQIGLPS